MELQCPDLNLVGMSSIPHICALSRRVARFWVDGCLSCVSCAECKKGHSDGRLLERVGVEFVNPVSGH